VTEQEPPQGGQPRPIPDLGFFAGPAKPRGAISSFGSAPAQPPSSPPAPSRFSTPSANQFGSTPPAPFDPPAQFTGPGGYPQPPHAYGPPQPYAYGPPQPYAYGPPRRGGLPVWAIIAICVPTVFIVLGILAAIAIPVFLNVRNTPVAPDQLGGLTASTDPQMTQAVASIRNSVAKENPRVKREVAGYGTLTRGYVLVAFNTRVNPEQEFRDFGASESRQIFNDVQCATSATDDTSVCLHTSTRGAVEVAAFGTVDLAKLAAVTDEAWAAQPFGT
jgi:hypothetical protein